MAAGPHWQALNDERVSKRKKYTVDEVRRSHAQAYAPWTAEDDDNLRRLAHMPVRELARMFGRTRGAIRTRLQNLGITPASGLRLSADRHQSEPQPSAESVRADKTKPPPKRPWTNEDEEKLRQLASVPLPALAEILQRTDDDVETRLYYLGLDARDEASLGLSRPRQIENQGRRRILTVACVFAAGLLIGLLLGFVVGRSRVPPAGPVNPEHQPGPAIPPVVAQRDSCVCVATWNIRGYPERREEDTAWFRQQLQELGAEVLCIQEVANGRRLEQLLMDQQVFTKVAYSGIGTGRDNAILAGPDVDLDARDSPPGFQHPAQSAYVAYEGLDAVVITVHLTWGSGSRRLEEMGLLEPLVRDMLKVDPDLMIVGDFNLSPEQAESFAERLGMRVLMGDNQLEVGTLHSGSSYDYFLVSPDLADEEAQGATVVVFDDADVEIARRVSDHKPLLAFFACDASFRDRPAESEAIE